MDASLGEFENTIIKEIAENLDAGNDCYYNLYW